MTKYAGHQVTLEWDPAGGTVWATIGQIGDISGPSYSRTSIDVSTRDTPELWMEFLKGMVDPGEITFTVMFDTGNTTHDSTDGIVSDFRDNATIPTWRISWPDGTTWENKGFLTGFEASYPLDDGLSADVTVKLTGTPTYT